MTTPYTDTRTAKAQLIVAAGDIHEPKPGVWRVRDMAGSKRWHYVSATSCSCEDHGRTGLRCKHMIALANWSAQQAASQPCTGETVPLAPTCPTCGAATKEDLLWCGKRAWQRFRVCEANREHKAIRI